ncbi:hypothetical protein DPMN_044902 [Dreissena polymorpha]|uniref:Uncharacterized protein n=1 Tax=Dreissena polymorpha TaxID=45954 RepID=A0A9D4D337_DREPO|nr:hypothetical protein DPMN_044902 [Dreissena polymorpha]
MRKKCEKKFSGWCEGILGCDGWTGVGFLGAMGVGTGDGLVRYTITKRKLAFSEMSKSWPIYKKKDGKIAKHHLLQSKSQLYKDIKQQNPTFNRKFIRFLKLIPRQYKNLELKICIDQPLLENVVTEERQVSENYISKEGKE